MAKVTKVTKPQAKAEVEHKGKVVELELPTEPVLDTGIKLGMDLGYTKHLGDHEFLKVNIHLMVPVNPDGTMTVPLEPLKAGAAALASWAEETMNETVDGILGAKGETPPWDDTPAVADDDVDVLAALGVDGDDAVELVTDEVLDMEEISKPTNDDLKEAMVETLAESLGDDPLGLGMTEDDLEEADCAPEAKPAEDDPLAELGEGWADSLQEPEVDTSVDETSEDDPLGLGLGPAPGVASAPPETVSAGDDDPLGLGL